MKKEALNPFLPADRYIPDGEPHVFGERVYLFGSHDREGGATFCMEGYEIFSAPTEDLSDWTSKGINYRADQDPLYSKDLPYMFAPDCVRGNDGKFYIYYCMAGEKGRGGYANPVSVAVADTPDGQYRYLGVVRDTEGKPLLSRVCFDPAVINDDGVIRMYFGTELPWVKNVRPKQLKNVMIGKITGRTAEEAEKGILGSYHVILSDDMQTALSEPVRIDDSIQGADYPAHAFFEGSSIRKIKDTYYFIYSSVNNHELCYAVSSRPDGGFCYKGTVVSNGDIGYNGRKPEDRLNHTGTNHGSIECVNGQWYVFYHRLTHNSDYSRQACAERIEILPDGSIPQVEITSCGLNGGPLKGGTYSAVYCCNLTDRHMKHGSNSNAPSSEPCVTDRRGERFVTGIRKGTKIGWKYFCLEGEAELSVMTRGTGTGMFSIQTDEEHETASVPVIPSKEWTESTVKFSVSKGMHPLFLTYRGKGSVELMQIRWEKNR